MKIEFTAETRPRMASGVSSCTRVLRVTTLMQSAAPATASAAIDNQNDSESPNTTVAIPKTATAASIRGPT